MQTIVLSTHNPDKVREMTDLIDQSRFKVLSKSDLGLEDLDIEETGDTLAENAKIKVEGLARAMREKGIDPDKYWIISDDTGLFVDALDGRPGVYSSRYAGLNVSYDDNINKLLREMEGVEEGKRAAHFSTVIALLKAGRLKEYEGRLDGEILTERRGNEGFGYDPLFYIPAIGKSLAQLPEKEKNAISHRAGAYRKLMEDINAGQDSNLC